MSTPLANLDKDLPLIHRNWRDLVQTHFHLDRDGDFLFRVIHHVLMIFIGGKSDWRRNFAVGCWAKGCKHYK
jgi:hypothetical protein